MNQIERFLFDESKLIISNYDFEFNSSSDKLNEWVKKWGETIETRITIIDINGNVLADSISDYNTMSNHINRPEIQEILDGNDYGIAKRNSFTLDKDMFYMAIPIINNNKISGFLRLAKSVNTLNQVIITGVKKYLVFILSLLCISILIILKMTDRIIEPLAKMTGMARDIANGNYSRRIKLSHYGRNIDEMAGMFNFMAKKLEHNINEISREKNKFEAILTSMVDGVIATDIFKNIILINPAARKMFALGNKNLNNKNIIEVTRHHNIDSFLTEVLQENKIITEEININFNDKVFRCHFAPITSEANEVTGGVIVFTDITELRKLEQVRKDFVANVSHELHTPLTSIIGYVDTLIESKIEDENTQNKFLKIIKSEADRLALLLKDLLNLSKVDGRKFNLKPGNLNKIIFKIIEILKDNAKEKNIKIQTDIEDMLPMVLMIPEQIEQVLINLIDNAIKYTSEEGKIIIKSYAKDNRVYVEIKDNGIGIPREDQERIFERFYRVDKARSRAMGGTGIGLSIVNNIIKGHNSEISIESELGKGTVFKFYLKRLL